MAVGILTGIILASVRIMGAHSFLISCPVPMLSYGFTISIVSDGWLVDQQAF